MGDRIRKVYLHDAAGLPVGSFNGALNVHDADVHERPLNIPVTQDTATTTTPSVAISAGDTAIALTSAAGFAIGDKIRLSETGVLQAVIYEITNLVTNTITLDMPIDKAFSTAASVIKVYDNLAQTAGTLASPQIFNVAPEAGEQSHTVRFVIHMVYSTNTDDSRFGDIAGGLLNGVVLRSTVDGVISNFTNWKTNGDMAGDAFDLPYSDKAGGGKYSLRGRFSVKIASGAVIKLDGDTEDKLEFLIQDDLTTLDSFNIKVQGHPEGV